MRHHVEVLTPKQDVQDLDTELEKFGQRYQAVMDAGYVVSITDNPMGILHFQAAEVIPELGLPIRPEQILIHLNTFHTKEHLDGILRGLLDVGINNLLAITGDGSERLPKLAPESIGFNVNSATSVELMRYIHKEYPGKFVTGVAFNPYEPQDHELKKMHRKVDAGATFIITQPVIGQHKAVDALRPFKLPVILDAWMSKKLHLLSQCVGYEIPESTAYDPIANLKELRKNYPDFHVYLALLGFKTQLPLLKDVLGTA